MPRIHIHEQGQEKIYELRKGLGLQALSAGKASPLEFDCRKADCGICIMRVRAGMENLSEKTQAESDFLRAMRAQDDERLACQCRVFGDIEIEVEGCEPLINDPNF